MLFSSVTKASTLLRAATSIFLAQPSISGARATFVMHARVMDAAFTLFASLFRKLTSVNVRKVIMEMA